MGRTQERVRKQVYGDAHADSVELSQILHLDGSTLEGGGQLLRNALALSALTSKPITISRIRGNRRGKTGLKGSHTAAVRFLADICGGDVIGANVGSSKLTFFPRGKPAGASKRPDAIDGKSIRRDLDDISASLSGLTTGALTCSPSGRTGDVNTAVTALQSTTPDDTWIGPPIRPEYNIRQSSAGSIFLIFQALYPYLLHAGAHAFEQPIRLKITGGTNVSFAPSYDYFSQVLVPNFAKLGLPPLSVNLHRRGWSTGPGDPGCVTFLIHPLGSASASSKHQFPEEDKGNEEVAGRKDDQKTKKPAESYSQCTIPSHCATTEQPVPKFPPFRLRDFERGVVTKVDITILAPDTPLQATATASHAADKGQDKWNTPLQATASRNNWERAGSAVPEEEEEAHSSQHDSDERTAETPNTVRGFVDAETRRVLSRALRSLPKTRFQASPDAPDAEESPVPIDTYTSEPTHHHARLYILLVAHTSTGFKLGRDALFDSHGSKDKDDADGKSASSGKGKGRGGKGKGRSSSEAMTSRIRNLVKRCVDGFIEELSEDTSDDEGGVGGIFTTTETDSGAKGQKMRGCKPCVDVFMRDQVVIFEALGKLQHEGKGAAGGDKYRKDEEEDERKEDERYWSLHTRTAMWVCETILGVKV